jgi:hypothetical protein
MLHGSRKMFLPTAILGVFEIGPWCRDNPFLRRRGGRGELSKAVRYRWLRPRPGLPWRRSPADLLAAKDRLLSARSPPPAVVVS